MLKKSMIQQYLIIGRCSKLCTPSFDKYLIHKKALLKKVNSTLQRLYEINKENHSVKTISRINELNKLKATIEKTQITSIEDYV
jgi:hypothetical protein